MNVARVLLATAVVAVAALPAAAQTPSVSITFQNGYVTVNARNAPLRSILQEWARVGQTRIVNAERVAGAPITIELENVPEGQAISTLLRGVSGYIVGARQAASTGPSAFDRILILPTSTASPTARVAPAPPPPVPTPTPVVIQPDPEDPQDAEATPGRPLTAQQLQNQIREANARAAAARAEQEEADPVQDTAPPPPGPATTTPNNPFFTGAGSGRPGEITPVPQQPRNPLRPNGDPEP